MLAEMKAASKAFLSVAQLVVDWVQNLVARSVIWLVDWLVGLLDVSLVAQLVVYLVSK